MYRKLYSVVYVIMICSLFLMCKQNGPDLVPERRSGSQGREGFCRRENSKLTVRVRNQGNQDVFQQFTTTVKFGTGDVVSATTAPMPAGSFSDVQFDIPIGCFSPDCVFTITVDSNNDIDEAIESNNTEDGICIG